MKKYFKYAAVIALFSAGVACEKKSSSSEPQAVSAAAEPSLDPLVPGAAVASSQVMMAPSGATVATSTVVAHESNVGETPATKATMSWDEIIAVYPALADRVNFLASVDKIVETDAHTFDLYSAGNIVMTLQYTAANDALVVKNSAHTGFTADLITAESMSAEQTQGRVMDRLDFIMSSCDVKKEEPKQQQEQAQAGKETPMKEQPAKVEEPKQQQEQAQTGKEAPAKEQPAKVEEPKQECASIIASLVLEPVVVKQEQEQKETPAKEEPKQEAKHEAPALEPKAPVQQEQK